MEGKFFDSLSAKSLGIARVCSINTVRGKGFVSLKDYPAVRFEFQMAGKSAQVQPKGEWGMQNPRTEVVFISLK